MGIIIEEIVNDFTLGITDDPRLNDKGLSQVVTNFDIFTNRRRMIPYLESESGDNAASTSQKKAFDIGYYTPGSDWRLFALGVQSGNARAEILMKSLSVGGSADLRDDTWANPSVNQSGSGTTSFNLFVYYKTTGKFYGAKAFTTIWAFTPDGSTAFDDSAHSLSYTNIAQGIVHSKDDILYIPYDNKIASNNNGSWTDAALTVPSKYKIVSICEYGSYLAVGCAPLSGTGKSRVFLWDRDSSLTTLTESIDWDEGNLTVLEELEGFLIGISITGGTTISSKQRIVFRKWNGGNIAKKFKELVANSAFTGLQPWKQKFNNRIFYTMHFTIDGVTRFGVWSVGLSSSGEFALAHERTPENDSSVGNFAMQGFFIVGDFMFISYVNASFAAALSKTDDTGSYIAKAIYETPIKNGGDSDLKKKLIGFGVTFEPLPANGKVWLYYKKDAETAWKRILTYDTDNAISKSGVRLMSDTTAVTVTIASPGVFTQSEHGLVSGQRIFLKTTGALPTGLAVDTAYYVISTGLTSSTFRLSATLAGAVINTSGTQSGTHTIFRGDDNLGEGKEFKFKIESTGGAVITGYKYKMEITGKESF